VVSDPIHYEDARRWGTVRWAQKAPEIAIASSSMRTSDHLRERLPAGMYYRLQADILRDHSAIDDCSSANIEYLKETGRTLIEEHEEELREIAKKLTVEDPFD
jgi:hypothetical protein